MTTRIEEPERRAQFSSYLALEVQRAICERTGIAFGWRKPKSVDPLRPDPYVTMVGGCEFCGYGFERNYDGAAIANVPPHILLHDAWEHMLRLSRQYNCPHAVAYTEVVRSVESKVRDHLEEESAKPKGTHVWDDPNWKIGQG